MTKIYKQIIAEEERQIEIDEITLLSVEEYKAYRNIISKIDSWWWLFSPSTYDNSHAIVIDNGSWMNDSYVDNDHGVRPALRIQNSKSSCLKIGDKFRLAGYIWTMLGNGLALCNDVIGNCVFRKNWESPDANIYKESDIKKWLENWATENGIEIEK